MSRDRENMTDFTRVSHLPSTNAYRSARRRSAHSVMLACHDSRSRDPRHLFDAEGRAVDFEVWLDDLQLFLQCDSKDGLSLFDLTSGASTAPSADADSTVRS
ncbi:unnamed protein product [Closterium sp. NIES-53]